MADRQLKIVVRTEIQKGFGQLSKEISNLAKQLETLSGLSNSINKLASAFDKVGAGANVARKATASLNKETNDAARIVKQYQTAQEKAFAKAEALNKAAKSGSVSRSSATNTEIRMLNDLIKKTGDLSILEKRRNSKGQFGYGGFSAESVKAVKDQLNSQTTAVEEGSSKLVTVIKDQSQRIKNAMDLLTRAGVSGSRGQGRTELQQFYNNLFSATEEGGIKLVTEINGQAARIKAAMENLTRAGTRGSSGGARRAQQASYDNVFNALPETQFYNGRWERGMPVSGRGSSGGGRGRGYSGGGGSGPGRLGPSAQDISGAKTLYETYVKLGHALFLLQYSTLTIFGATGAGYIAKQIDTFVTLRNQVARTSDSIADLGDNMRTVKDIANSTFSDVSSVGQIFSSINKYSKDLKIDKAQVGTVTRNIASAYAASPGTADAKGAAQYQLIQAITSNRLGGDELRSQLEQAPLVAEILQKGIAKVRGTTGAVDLRDPKNPVRTAELVKVFSDPEVTKELKELLGKQARTFGDAATVLKNRMVDVGETFEKYLGPSINNLAQILSSDSKWSDFVDGIKKATVALVALATAAIVNNAFSAGGIGRKVVGGGITAAKGFAGDVGTYFAGASRAAEMRGVGVAGLVGGDILKGFLPMLGNIIKSFFSLGGILAIVAAAIVALVARFNSLLGKFGGGATLFDLLGVAWDKLVKTMSDVGDWLANSFVGKIFDAFVAFVDSILKLLGKSLLNDPDVQKKILARGGATNIAMSTDGKNAMVQGYNSKGQLITGLADRAGPDLGMGPTFQRDKDGKILVKDAQGKMQALDPNGSLPSGIKSSLPTPKPAKEKESAAQKLAKRWQEYIRDTLENISGVGQELERISSDYPDEVKNALTNTISSVKRGADILDIKTKGKDIGDLFQEITKKLGGKRASEFKTIQLDQFTNNVELAYQNQLKAYSDAIENAALSAAQQMPIAGLSSKQKSINDVYNSVSSQFIDRISKPEALNLYKSYFGDKVPTKDDGSVDEVAVTGGLKKHVTNRTLASGPKAGLDLVMGALDPAQAEQATKALNDQIQLIEERDKYIKNGWNGAKDALASYRDSLRDTAGDVQNVLGNAFRGLEDTMTDWITTGKLNWKSFLTQILADIARVFVRQRLLKPLFDWMGNSGGGGSSGGSTTGHVLSTVAAFAAKVFLHHDGGVAGSGIGMTRSINPAIFNGAPRYHNGGIAGLMPNEVPAILQRGETIIPRGRSSSSGTFAPTIAITYNAAPEHGGSSGMSQEDHAKMLTDMVTATIQKQIVEYDVQRKRPGTAAYLANKH